MIAGRLRKSVHSVRGRTSRFAAHHAERSRPAEAAGWRDRCASSGRVGQGLLLRRMVGLRILGSGSSWIGFWVVVASWNRRCFQDRSRRASDSLRRDRGCCDFQRQFDGPLACSASQPTPRCHHLKAAVAARSCAGRSLVHFAAASERLLKNWIGGQRQRPAAPEGGATGALAAGVPLPGVCSGAWFGDFSASIRIN